MDNTKNERDLNQEKLENKVVATESEKVVNETPAEPVSEAAEEKSTKTTEAPIVESAHDDFNWDMDNAGFDSYSDDVETGMKDEYKVSFKAIEEKQVETGSVVSITEKHVVVNIGFKSDGLIAINEFKDKPDLKVGDKIEVFVEKTEDKLGQLILSYKKAKSEKAWERVNELYTSGEIVNAFVHSRTKGGLVVEVEGLDCFLPGSQIDVKRPTDYDQYVGKNMEVKVLKLNEVYKNAVVSHKIIIEDDKEEQRGEIVSKLEVGMVLEGEIKNMAKFGAFVDLGGVDGLLHITDLSWNRISHPEEVIEVGQKLKVVVLSFEDDKKRISLGLKQLQEHPWTNLPESIKEGNVVKGKVVSLTDYGAFIALENGIEGLVHVSEMSWSQHLRNPSDFLTEGDEIETKILNIDQETKKISLGIKQLTVDPWASISEKYPNGSKHKGIVKNLTNYGLFVELEEGVDGLVHVSDLSWNKRIKHPAEFVKRGEELEVVVLEVDLESRRLSLGHKQLEENPWDTFESIFTVGSNHKGIISEVNEKGATVQLEYDVEGFAPKRHLKKQDNSLVAAEEELEFIVIEFSKYNRRIILSHTNLWKEEERGSADDENKRNVKKHKRANRMAEKINSSMERSTIGDLGGLGELKEMFQKSEKGGTKKETPKKEAKVETPAKEKKVETPAKEKKEVKAKKTVAKKEKSDDVDVEANQKALFDVVGTASADNKDDLKKIKGVGPVFEKKLNEFGIYTYEQLSKLNKPAIEAIETLTKFPGRVEREGWIDQSKELLKK